MVVINEPNIIKLSSNLPSSISLKDQQHQSQPYKSLGTDFSNSMERYGNHFKLTRVDLSFIIQFAFVLYKQYEINLFMPTWKQDRVVGGRLGMVKEFHTNGGNGV